MLFANYPGAFLDFFIAIGALGGAFVGAICSIVAVRPLRTKVIWKSACWLVPACAIVVVGLELGMPELIKWKRGVAIWIGSPLLAMTYVCIARWLPDRPTPGFCSRCRYDLTGNVSGVCPECGTPMPKDELVGGTQDWPEGEK